MNVIVAENATSNKKLPQRKYSGRLPRDRTSCRDGGLSDVNDNTNVMYFTQGQTDDRLRDKSRTHHYKAGSDTQWEMIPRS